MSASLVGSEMCIRDSFDSWESLASLGWSDIGALFAPAGGPEATCFARACLLYTSDAADDM
eukprot:9273012-Alexandrium_andersonii.AAC.1